MIFTEEWKESRWFACGWTPRKEGVLKVASRLQAMAAALEAIDAGLGELWPQFEARRLRPSDPGPLLALSPGDLAHLIDRHARADPPALPAPVSSGGYHFALAGLREGRIGVNYGGNLWVESDLYSLEEPVRLTLGNDDAIWRSAAMAEQVLSALVDAWSADWAVATAHVSLGFRANGELVAEQRPWMAWAASGHSVPGGWVRHAGTPVDVRGAHGGQLTTWRWPPSRDQAPS